MLMCCSDCFIIHSYQMSDTYSDPELPETSPLPSNLTKVSNLYQLFKSQEYSHCISHENTEALISILEQNQKVHHQLLDCMLCIPNQQLQQILQDNYTQQEINNLPYKCYQLLDGLDQQYSKNLFEISTKTQQYIQSANAILKHYFSIFKTQNINETAAGYVLRVCEKILMRESSFYLYQWLNNYEDVLTNILQCFYSYSAVGIINRALDLDSDKVTAQERTHMIESIFKKVTSLTLQLKNVELLDGLKFFLDEQLERALSSENSEELTKQIVNKNNLIQLKSLSQAYPDSLIYHFEMIASILLHYKKQETKPQTTNFHNRNFMGYRQPQQMTIDPQVLQLIIQMLQNSSNYTEEQQKINQSNYINKTYFNYLRALQLISLYNPQKLKQIVRVDILNKILQRMRKYSKNNVFHNFGKSVIVGTLKVFDRQEIVYKKECNLVNFVFVEFDLKDHQYHQHLCDILNCLLEDPTFQTRCQNLTTVSLDDIMNKYKQMRAEQHKLQMEDPNPSNQQIDNDLADFDPTNNVDTQSPYYYYGQMVIDDNYQQQKDKNGSYSQWAQGIMKAGILDKQIDLDISQEVESPIVKIQNKDRISMEKAFSLLDSQSEDLNLLRNKSNSLSKDKEKEKGQQKNIQTIEEQLNDEKLQENLKSLQQQNRETLRVDSYESQKKDQFFKQQNTSPTTSLQDQIKDIVKVQDQKSIVKTILHPIKWFGQFFWNISG